MKNLLKMKSEANLSYMGLKKAIIFGVGVTISDKSRVLNQITRVMRKKAFDRPLFVVTVNSEFIVQAQEDKKFRDVLNRADIAVADGAGLRLAEPRLSILPGRKIAQEIISAGVYRMFFLGGRGGVARLMAEKFGGEWDEGHFDIKSQMFDAGENKRVIDKINRFRPDALLVAYGAPWQEKWIWNNLKAIKAKVVMGVGGTFDYLTGKVKPPPEWVAEAGLEWLWRLIQEPWRWRRQMRLVKFAWLVLRKSSSCELGVMVLRQALRICGCRRR